MLPVGELELLQVFTVSSRISSFLFIGTLWKPLNQQQQLQQDDTSSPLDNGTWCNWKQYVIFRAGGQQYFLHLSQSGSITILPVFDCGCRAPSRTSKSWLIDHLLAWSIFNAPFDKITFSRVRDFTLLGRRSSEKTGSLLVLLHEGTAFRGPRSPCLADSCDFFSEMTENIWATGCAVQTTLPQVFLTIHACRQDTVLLIM